MSAKNATGINIPSVFVGQSAGMTLNTMYTDPDFYVVITSDSPFNIQTHLLIPFAIVVGICFIVMVVFMVCVVVLCGLIRVLNAKLSFRLSSTLKTAEGKDDIDCLSHT